MQEENVYHTTNVLKFLMYHRDMVGDAAPHIALRAFKRASGSGAIMAGNILEIFDGNINLAQGFGGMVMSDLRHIEMLLCGLSGKPVPIDTTALFFVLFGVHIPETLAPFMKGEDRDGDRFNTILQAELKQCGVEWDIPIQIEFVEAPPP